MTKKHYIEVAAMLHDQMEKTRKAERERVSKITLELALIFKRDNAHFDAGVFFVAAGFPEHINTKQGTN